MHVAKRVSTYLLASVAAACLAGCAVGPDFMRPPAPVVSGYTPDPLPAVTASADIQGGDAQKFLQDTDVSGQWWTLFHSAVLNDLVDQALKANPDLEAAQAALRQASENYAASEGPLLPSVTLGDTTTRQHTAPQTGGTTLNLFNASVGVSYVADIWGGTRRAVEASGAAQENQRFQLEATYLTLISNVLTATIQVASLSAQIAAVNDIITAQNQELDLLNQQFELGAVAKGDVLAQQSQLASTQASLSPLQKNLAQVRNQLATLLGRFPVDGRIPNIVLTDLQLPQELPLSLPSKLVEQRPDVRASEALLHQASAQIGVATANMLPSLTLSATGTSAATSASTSADFFSGPTQAWSIAAAISAPLFRGGQLYHQREASVAAYQRANAQYRSTVLTAFSNVANVLAALTLDAEQLKTQLYAEETAQQSLDITMERFQAGAIAYLSLLDAQRTYQQARIALVQAQANRYADTVALFQALGGGWWNRQDVQPYEVDEIGFP